MCIAPSERDAARIRRNRGTSFALLPSLGKSSAFYMTDNLDRSYWNRGELAAVVNFLPEWNCGTRARSRSKLGDQRIIFLTPTDSIIGTQRFAWIRVCVYARASTLAHFIRVHIHASVTVAVHILYTYTRACCVDAYSCRYILYTDTFQRARARENRWSRRGVRHTSLAPAPSTFQPPATFPSR